MPLPHKSYPAAANAITLAESGMNWSCLSAGGFVAGFFLPALVSLLPGVRDLPLRGPVADICIQLWMGGWAVFSLASLPYASVLLTRAFWQPESPMQRGHTLGVHLLAWFFALIQAFILLLVLTEDTGS